jgi:putative DNA primase/helicase
VRQLRDMLVVPARAADGTLQSLQFIGTDGAKRFLTGGRVAGCYHGIGKPAGQLLLGEGLATCCTLFEATGQAVAVCFHAGNLEPVARALRGKFPRLRLVICADNDRSTPGNPGVTKALAAARAVGGYVAIPNFESITR